MYGLTKEAPGRYRTPDGRFLLMRHPLYPTWLVYPDGEDLPVWDGGRCEWATLREAYDVALAEANQ